MTLTLAPFASCSIEAVASQSSLFCGFGCEKRRVAVRIVHRFGDGFEGQIELLGRTFRAPGIGAHLSYELPGGDATTLEQKLATPRVAHADKMPISALRRDGARQLRCRICKSGFFWRNGNDSEAVVDGIGKASKEGNRAAPDLGIIAAQAAYPLERYHLCSAKFDL